MNETQQPVENFQQLYAEIRKYFLLQKEFVKVDFVEKLSILLSTFIILFVVVALIMSTLLFLFIALAYALESLVGSLALSFAIIALFYVFLIVVFYSLRKKLIINPIVNLLAGLFLNKEKE